jgi:hypothetical protein
MVRVVSVGEEAFEWVALWGLAFGTGRIQKWQCREAVIWSGGSRQVYGSYRVAPAIIIARRTFNSNCGTLLFCNQNTTQEKRVYKELTSCDFFSSQPKDYCSSFAYMQMTQHDFPGHFRTFHDAKRRRKSPLYKQINKSSPKHKQPTQKGGIASESKTTPQDKTPLKKIPKPEFRFALAMRKRCVQAKSGSVSTLKPKIKGANSFSKHANSTKTLKLYRTQHNPRSHSCQATINSKL